MRVGTQRLATLTPPGGIPATWTYDARGNLINDGAGQSFSYDAQNRMATAVGGGFTTQFAYNAQGQRMLKKRVSGGSGSDYFVYDDVGRLLGVYDETGTVREEFVWLDGFRPVMTARGTGPIYDVYRIVSDRQQIPIGVLDATGTRIWEWDGREPYGYQLPNQDKDGDSVYFTLNLRMPGQWFDTETGLYHNGFRDYDPKVGRYVQPDPIGLAGGWNEYAYVGGNPMDAVDPYGLSTLDFLSGISDGISYADQMITNAFMAVNAPSLPQGVVDFSAGAGDIASWGLTQYARNVNGTSSFVGSSDCYNAGAKLGFILSIPGGFGGMTVANMGIKAGAKIGVIDLFHYTSKEAATNIAANGLRANKGIFGSAVYATPFGSSTARILGAGSTEARVLISPSSKMVPTFVPGNIKVIP